jgi:hypothetical protein
MEAAARRDPGNWQYSYGLALTRALVGRDPRPAAALAARQNPLDRLAHDLDEQMRKAGRSKRRWFRVAVRAEIPRR